MAHLHTGEGGHDITVSALVLRAFDDGWKVLVHRHKRTGLTLQPGGHVEHDETPWQALAHELAEESGYELARLQVLQPLPPVPYRASDNLTLPSPMTVHTHEIYPGHWHDDLVYVLVADDDPTGVPGEGESQQIWWASPAELAADPDAALFLGVLVERVMAEVLPGWHRVATSHYPCGGENIMGGTGE